MRANWAKTLLKGLKLLVREPGTCWKKVRAVLWPMRADYRKRLGMTLGQWLKYHQENIVFDKCYWMGARALKNPFDAWIYQEIIYEIQPDIIVEIGSAYGGSTLYFANLLDLIGKGTVVSIDIDRTLYNVKHQRVVEVTGDSSSSEVIDKVAALCADKTVLVVHDGNHRKEQVSKDLECYSRLVSVGSYLIVEDGVIDLFRPGDGMGRWYEGPLIAVEEFLRTDPTFVVDAGRERYILTYNPKGYLKRIK